jgi:hypothetical protein
MGSLMCKPYTLPLLEKQSDDIIRHVCTFIDSHTKIKLYHTSKRFHKVKHYLNIITINYYNLNDFEKLSNKQIKCTEILRVIALNNEICIYPRIVYILNKFTNIKQLTLVDIWLDKTSIHIINKLLQHLRNIEILDISKSDISESKNNSDRRYFYRTIIDIKKSFYIIRAPNCNRYDSQTYKYKINTLKINSDDRPNWIQRKCLKDIGVRIIEYDKNSLFIN